MKYVIIGNGAAGMEAAFSIRKYDAEGDITVLSDSPYHYYYRPKVINYLAGEATVESLYLREPGFYARNGITVKLNIHAEKIDRAAKQVICAESESYQYNKLLIATGARSFVPPIEGSTKNGVFTLRGITDADEMRAYAKRCKSAIVIGGGLLGLEAARSLILLGLATTVIEFSGRLLHRQLDEEAAKAVREKLETMGMNFVLSESVAAINGAAGAESVTLKSGMTLPGEFVLISAGVRGRAELAEDADLTMNNGIVVNDYLETDDPAIYCAGDPAEHRGRLYGIWPACREQGMKAGLNMAGVKTEYTGTVMSNELKIVGVDVFSAGNIDAEKKLEERINRDGNAYRRIIIENGKIAGAIVIGDKDYAKKVMKVFSGELTLRDI